MTSSSNSTFSYAINSNSTSKFLGFKQPTHGLGGQFLWTNMGLSMLLVWKQHQQNAIKIITTTKSTFNLIWLVGMLKMCRVTNVIVGNLFFSLCHQDKVHLQFSTSIGYQYMVTNKFLCNQILVCICICCCVEKWIFKIHLIFNFYTTNKHQQLGNLY